MTSWQQEYAQASPQKTAFTLIELLVAIAIASVLTIVALPRIREGMQQNVATRTTTLVRSAFENARAQAIRSGRPYGVRLHRAANVVTPNIALNDPLSERSHGANYCKQISYVQMAFEYQGDDENASLNFRPSTQSNRSANLIFVADEATSGLLYAVATGRVPVEQQPFGVGSVIRIGRDATPYKIVSLTADTTLSISILEVSTQDPIRAGGRSPSKDIPYPFAIETWPISSPLTPIELPGKLIIDLAASGTSYEPTLFSPYSIQRTSATPPVLTPGSPSTAPVYGFRDLIVMFAPTGLMESIYVDQFNSTTSTFNYLRLDPPGSLSFLVGEVDGIVLPQTIGVYPSARTGTNGTSPPINLSVYGYDGKKSPNYANSNDSWVTVHAVSGKALIHSVAAPFNLSQEASAHPEYSTTHSLEIIVRNRLIDSRRLLRGQI